MKAPVGWKDHLVDHKGERISMTDLSQDVLQKEVDRLEHALRVISSAPNNAKSRELRLVAAVALGPKTNGASPVKRELWHDRVEA